MRVLIVADGGSPISQSWIRRLCDGGNEVHLVSSYPFDESRLPQLRSSAVIPLAMSRWSRGHGPSQGPGAASTVRRIGKRLLRGGRAQYVALIREWIGAGDALRLAPRLRALVAQIRPEVVHALRIPFEGMLAAEAVRTLPVPLALSVWGNDFTLHAANSRVVAGMTKRALRRADGLHPDCERDLELARRHGFGDAKPSLVMPGNGGVSRELFHPGPPQVDVRSMFGIEPSAPIVINPRGVRTYVRNDVFFRSVPLVLERIPQAVFVCLGMAGDATVARWVRELNIENSVRLIPPQPPSLVADLFRVAAVSVSPSEHDGTPNTLLEAMASGSLPVCGDIASVREWITDGQGGLLTSPADPVRLAACITRAVSDEALRARAQTVNLAAIERRADGASAASRAIGFYRDVVASAERRS